MNVKRFCLSVLAVYVAMFISGQMGSFLAMDYFTSFFAIARQGDDLTKMMPFTMIGFLISTIIFCYFYVVGRKTGDIKEGAKYGVIFALLLGSLSMVNYSMLPYEMPVLIAEICVNIFTCVVGGMTIAKVYKPAS